MVSLSQPSRLNPGCKTGASALRSGLKRLFLILSAGYLVLECYGGPGESSTDDDIMAPTTGKQLRASQGCAADSGINLRFSSTSQSGSLSSFSRQVLSHLRNLQANLNYLKVTNTQQLQMQQHRYAAPLVLKVYFCLSCRRLRPSTII